MIVVELPNVLPSFCFIIQAAESRQLLSLATYDFCISPPPQKIYFLPASATSKFSNLCLVTSLPTCMCECFAHPKGKGLKDVVDLSLSRQPWALQKF